MIFRTIVSADWSAAASATTDTTITMTSLENTASGDGIAEGQQYYVYCWAKDSAVDSNGFARVNYMTQTYVCARSV